MVIDTWKGVGYIMVILLAGLQSDSARILRGRWIDGAGAWARFWHITLPMLMPAIMVVTVLNVLYGLQDLRHRLFDHQRRPRLRQRGRRDRKSSRRSRKANSAWALPCRAFSS